MRIEKDNKKIKNLYHYTKKENVEKILSSKKITSRDYYLFFTDDYYKSIRLFEEEMMSNKPFIDLDGKLKRRNYAKPEDYRILKIPYQNDGKFVKMIFHEKDHKSIYHESTIHEGELFFNPEEVEVLDIPVKKGHLPNFGFLLKLSFLFTMFIAPIKAKADTWLDSEEYYDISWWTGTEPPRLAVTEPTMLAGILYLNKTYGYTFSDSWIYIEPENCPENRSCTIDMSAHDWVPFSADFGAKFERRWYGEAGFCGYHRILLKSIDRKINFTETDRCKITIFDAYPPYDNYTCDKMITYNVYHTIHASEAENGTYQSNVNIELQNKEVTVNATPEIGYEINYLSAKTKSGSTLRTSCIRAQNKCTFTMPDDEVNISLLFKKKTYTITVSHDPDLTTVSPEGNVEVEYLGEKTFKVNPKIDYDFVGYKMNNGELIPVNGNYFTISNVTDNASLEIVLTPTKYRIENISKGNNYNFEVDNDFSAIKIVKICSSNSICKTLKANEYSVKNQIINLKDSFVNNTEEGNYELQVTFANLEEASSNFRLTHQANAPTIVNNPKTNSNILITLIVGLVLFVIMGFKKKRVDSEWKK